MRRSNSRSLLTLAALVTLGCGGAVAAREEPGLPPDSTDESMAGLVTAGSVSNYGAETLVGSFTPDPHIVSLVSGADSGSLVNVEELGITPQNASGQCTGVATSQPDFILHLDSPGAFLRFFVTAPGDTTLVINDGAGHFWCSDDEGGNLNPLIDIQGPPPGQYDIWVGSYEAGANIQAVLSITTLETVIP